jgi:hypothetical protein
MSSNFGKKIENDTMRTPPPSQINEDGPILPYFLVADEGFPLTKYMMRPYPGKATGELHYSKNIFNYRLSRARRVIENAFGIMASRWRIYRRPIIAAERTVCLIMQATICLHNFILTKEGGKNHKYGHKYCANYMMDRENDNGEIVPGMHRMFVSQGI